MTFTGRGGSNPPSDTQLAAGTQEAPRNRSASGGSRFPNISPSDMRRSSASRRSATVGSRRSTDGRSRPGATSQRRRGGNGCTSRPSTQPRAGTACAQWALDDGNPAHVRAVPPTSTAVFTTASPSVSRPAIAGSVRPPSSPTTPSKPPRSRAPRPRGPHKPESRWGQYKRDHPERARLYKSAAWTSARDRQLREHPNCAACGAKASVADHVLNRARGGADLDPRNLQSLCRRCHLAKTVQEGHRGNKRAAERRRRGRA